jgi:general secretion pathway protein K
MRDAEKNQLKKSGHEGFIIIAVLWILAALATLASIYAIYVTNTAIAVSANSDAIFADPLAAGGVELAAYQLVSAPQDKRPSAGNFTARIGTANLAVDFVTEAARIDLNMAPKELLTGLFVGLGAVPLDAAGYADRIVGWRTKAQAQDSAETGYEDSLYRSGGLVYAPRHAPFAHPQELWLVYGIPPAFIQSALPLVTVYSGQAQIDIADAAPLVIAALPNMSPQIVQQILAARASGELDQQTLAALTGGSGGGQQASQAYRVGVRIDHQNGRHSSAEAVILLSDDGVAPYRVLSWRNGYDGATDRAMDFNGR